MKLIKLTQGYYTKVDDADFDWLSKYPWRIYHPRNMYFYARTGYDGNLMHRIIMRLNNSKLCVDHIDHDGLNNQRSNLRVCTHAENMRHRKSANNSSSKYLGVCLIKAYNKNGTFRTYYYATIKYSDKQTHLGCFKDERRAAIEYDKAAIIHHKEFANLNILKIIT